MDVYLFINVLNANISLRKYMQSWFTAKVFWGKICESVKKAYEYGAICLFYTLFSYLCSA